MGRARDGSMNYVVRERERERVIYLCLFSMQFSRNTGCLDENLTMNSLHVIVRVQGMRMPFVCFMSFSSETPEDSSSKVLDSASVPEKVVT